MRLDDPEKTSLSVVRHGGNVPEVKCPTCEELLPKTSAILLAPDFVKSLKAVVICGGCCEAFVLDADYAVRCYERSQEPELPSSLKDIIEQVRGLLRKTKN